MVCSRILIFFIDVSCFLFIIRSIPVLCSASARPASSCQNLISHASLVYKDLNLVNIFCHDGRSDAMPSYIIIDRRVLRIDHRSLVDAF